MAIPQTPSPLSAVVAAKTYNAQWFSGNIPEAQITNAIAAAALDGSTQAAPIYVFIPGSMRGYNPALVTFNANVPTYTEDDLAKAGIVTSGAFGAVVMANAFFGATNEAKITAAIAFAKLNGFKFVFIPQSFLPYTGALVTFDSAVQLTTNLNLQPGIYDARAYGGLPNAGTAIQLACGFLPSTGGIVDVRGFTGNQTITGDVLFSVTTEKPITIIFGPSTWTHTGGNSAYIASFFGSQIVFELHGTKFILNDGQNQSYMFGSDQTAGNANASVVNGSANITLAGQPSRGVTLALEKCIGIFGHTPSGGRDNTTLNGALPDAVGTTVVLTSITGQIVSGAGTFYFRVDNEIIGYQTANVAGNTITNCTRGALGSTAVSHLNGATVDRVVYDNYTIKGIAGLVLTLDRVVANAPTMTAVPTIIGPTDCGFVGTGILDGNRPAADTAANGIAIQQWFSARFKTERGITFQHWDHGAMTLYQSQNATIDGSFFDIGTPSVNLGFSILFFQGCRYCTGFGDYDRCNQCITLDDRTTPPQIYDQQPLGCIALPRQIRNCGYGIKFEGSSRSYGLIPFIENWGVDGGSGTVFALTAPQWVTAGPGLGNFFEIGYCSPTGSIGSLGAGTKNTFVNVRTPLCTVINAGDETNVIWTIGAIAGLNYGPLVANPMQFGDLVNIQNSQAAATRSILNTTAPDQSVFGRMQTFNTGSAAVPTTVGNVSNHPVGLMTNNLNRFVVDVNGNLVADTTNGGTLQDRLGSAAAVSKHVRIPFQASGLTTVSAADVSVSSFVLPAAALAVNGQAVRLTMRGSSVAQAGVPNIKFGATVVATGTVTAGNVYEIDAIITRTGAATQIAVATLDNGTVIGVNSRTTPAETLANAITIDFRGSIPAGGTLNVDYVQVEYMAS